MVPGSHGALVCSWSCGDSPHLGEEPKPFEPSPDNHPQLWAIFWWGWSGVKSVWAEGKAMMSTSAKL